LRVGVFAALQETGIVGKRNPANSQAANRASKHKPRSLPADFREEIVESGNLCRLFDGEVLRFAEVGGEEECGEETDGFCGGKTGAGLLPLSALASSKDSPMR
jgi:hypothetical protein